MHTYESFSLCVYLPWCNWFSFICKSRCRWSVRSYGGGCLKMAWLISTRVFVTFHSYVWHLRCMRTTYLYVWHESFVCATVAGLSLILVQWLMDVCDMTYSANRHDQCICKSWRNCPGVIVLLENQYFYVCIYRASLRIQSQIISLCDYVLITVSLQVFCRNTCISMCVLGVS